MANEEQIHIIKQGKDVWNEWRSKNPTAQLDLSGTHWVFFFWEIDLRGANLREAILSPQSTKSSS
jgi:hypothetical protein